MNRFADAIIGGWQLNGTYEWQPYFIDLNLDPNNSSFGFFSTQRNLPRDIQLGLKFVLRGAESEPEAVATSA